MGGGKNPVLPDTAPGDRGGLDSPLNSADGRNLKGLSGENPGNFHITEGFGLGDGTDGQKINGNADPKLQAVTGYLLYWVTCPAWIGGGLTWAAFFYLNITTRSGG